MKLIIGFFLLITLISCSPFHQLSKETKIGNEDGYVAVTNDQLKLKSLTFGDFKFAQNNKEYKKLKTDSTLFDNILFYAATNNPAYDYYILVDPVDTIFNLKLYELEKVIHNEHRYYLLISKSTPFSDAKFIRNSFTVE
jgi:hypothetical protein